MSEIQEAPCQTEWAWGLKCPLLEEVGNMMREQNAAVMPTGTIEVLNA